MTAKCAVCQIHAESVFKIEGMDCHEEVAILERTLKRLTGLEALDADVMAQRLRVKHDAAMLSPTRIAEAVARTGMRAWLEHESAVQPSAATGTRTRLVVISGVLLAAGLPARAHTGAWPASRGCRSRPRSSSPAFIRPGAPGSPCGRACSTSTS